MDTLAGFKKGAFTASDDTIIGYRHIGNGTGVLLVHGGLQSSLNFTTLARLLSAHYTVYVPDRRGRGLSPNGNNNSSLHTQAADISRLAEITDSKYIFGLSSGAVISLQAAMMNPLFKKVALYEPPLPIEGHPFVKLQEGYASALHEGNLGKAFVQIVKGTGDSSFFAKLPTFIIAPFVNLLIKAQKETESKLPLKSIVPTFQYDLQVVKESQHLLNEARNLQTEVLLMKGAKSLLYLQQVVDHLQQIMPNAKSVVFEKSGHLAADNSGSPQKVADQLTHFFAN
jgi:pimeloyl-ACP methyl ester carboxylesterase